MRPMGPTTPKATAQFEKYRHLLRHETGGAEKVIRALRHLCSKHPECERGRASARLLPQQPPPHGLREAKAQGLPIGSGVVEATCKTLVTERLKRSGMRWSERGGQAILTLRALLQSNRFDSGWSLLLQTYRAEVSAPDNVVPLRRQDSIKNDQFGGTPRCRSKSSPGSQTRTRSCQDDAPLAAARSRSAPRPRRRFERSRRL